MRKRNLVATVFLGIFVACLAGCATAGKLNKVRVGMSKADVIGLMGAPDSTSAQDGVEVLDYSLSETLDQAFYRTTFPYFVRLTAGKVDAYGRKDGLGGPPDENQALKVLSELKAERKPPIVAAPAPEDIDSKLAKLKKLAEDGLITPAEYEEQKKYLLSEFISR